MRKNMRVIQISGFRGILMVVFIATCLAAGFIAFPAIVAMNLWNYAASYIAIPLINVWQGLMLWAIVAISVFIINDRKKYLIAFSPKSKLSDEEIKKILDKVKIQSQARALNSMMLNSDIKPDEKKNDLKEKEKENV